MTIVHFDNAVFVDHGDSISEFAEPDCSLPILDPLIKWRVNGELREEKIARRKKQNKVRDTMKLINELDPLPVNMVKVTTEDTWERLIRIIKRQKKEIEDLSTERKELHKEKEKLAKEKNIVLTAKEKAEAENSRLKITRSRLEEENKKLASIKGAGKVVDADMTFNYIKHNYCKIRHYYEANGYKGLEAHEKTKERFLKDEICLPFLYDFSTLNKSLKYWEVNYKPNYK